MSELSVLGESASIGIVISLESEPTEPDLWSQHGKALADRSVRFRTRHSSLVATVQRDS